MSVPSKPDQRSQSRVSRHLKQDTNGSGSEDGVQRQRLLQKQRDESSDSMYGTIANTMAGSSSSSSLPANAIQHASNTGSTTAVSRISYPVDRTDSAPGSIYAVDNYGSSNTKSGQSTPNPKGFVDAGRQRILGKVKQRKYWSYYVPIISWAPDYIPKALIGDILAGLTLTCLLVPQSMSYASGLAHLDPVNGALQSQERDTYGLMSCCAGLFGVILPTFVYTFFGTCGQLSVGPEAGLSLLIGQTLDKLVPLHADGNTEAMYQLRASIVSAIVFEVGLLTFLLGILRLGFLDAVLSRALLRGFITALGLVIFIEQAIPLLGLDALSHARKIGQHPIDKLLFVIEHVGQAHRLTAVISAVCLLVLITAKILKPRIAKTRPWISFIPEILLVVIVATVLCDYFDWDECGVSILGKVSAGAVHAHFPIHQGKIWKYAVSEEVLSAAVTLSIIGYVDTIVAAKQNAAKFNYAISPNRELTAMGLANMAASLVSGTIPGYGSITRSRIAANTGARSPLFSFFVSAFSLITTLSLLKYLFYLPKAVLSCIISLVVYSILAEFPEDVQFFISMQAWADLALMSLAFALTLLSSVQTGIVASVAVSLVLVVKQSARSMGIQIMGRVPGTEEWAPVDDSHTILEEELVMHEEVQGVLIVRLRETLHFANAGTLKDRLRRMELYGTDRHHPADAPTRSEAQIIVFHMRDLFAIDACAMQILLETWASYASRGVQIYLAHVSAELRSTLERAKVYGIVSRGHDLPTVKDCLERAHVLTVSMLQV